MTPPPPPPLAWNQRATFYYDVATGRVLVGATTPNSKIPSFKFADSLSLFYVTILGSPAYADLEWTENGRRDFEAFCAEAKRYQTQPILYDNEPIHGPDWSDPRFTKTRSGGSE